MRETWWSRLRSEEMSTPSRRTWLQETVVSAPSWSTGYLPLSVAQLCLELANSSSVLSVLSFRLILGYGVSTVHQLNCLFDACMTLNRYKITWVYVCLSVYMCVCPKYVHDRDRSFCPIFLKFRKYVTHDFVTTKTKFDGQLNRRW